MKRRGSTYGINLVTAALGAIEKADVTFRVIHDTTHGVLVNPRIVQRDQVRSPGIGEARVIMRHARDVGGTVFGLKGDVKMAHRRCKIRREDHGFQACQLREDTVWLNEVRTFGVGTAAYILVVASHGSSSAGVLVPSWSGLGLAAGLRGR